MKLKIKYFFWVRNNFPDLVVLLEYNSPEKLRGLQRGHFFVLPHNVTHFVSKNLLFKKV